MVKSRMRPERAAPPRLHDALKELLRQHQERPHGTRRRSRARGGITSLARVEVGDSFFVVTRFPWVPWSELSDRERQVAVLVREGNSDKAIAARLGIRPPTVGVYIRRIYSKLAIHSRVTLGQYALLETGGSWDPINP